MRIFENVKCILAIELLCAAQRIDFRGPDKLGKGTEIAYSIVRRTVPVLEGDGLYKDVEMIANLIKSEKLWRV